MQRRPRIRTALIAFGLVLAAPSAAAAQTADIEAVWSFDQGQVAVQVQPDGSYAGTVIRETRFSTCTHPVRERMWTDMRLQPDGQYWGYHQWFNNSTCEPLPNRGPTAWRVLAGPDGAKFLRICFGKPENPDVQPSIAPDGSSTNVSDECRDSALVRALPAGKPKLEQIATLPRQGRRCRSRRSFRIRLKEPPGDALLTASVFVNGRRVQTRSGNRITAPVNLRGLPRGRYTVKITGRTVLGRTISGQRRYRTCAPKRRR